jgi:outer membrane protein assembly factor BamB
VAFIQSDEKEGMKKSPRRTSAFLALVIIFTAVPPVLASDWLTFGHDPQRSGWSPDEDTISVKNAADLTLKWKTHLVNKPMSLTALTAPLVASGVTTPEGVKTLVFVGGSSDHLFAVDAATGRLAWTHNFETHALPKDAGMWLCPNNLNATPTIDARTGVIYAVASDGRLFGLDLGTGNVRFGPVQFVPPYSKVWSLNLYHGVIYTSISQGCGGAQSGIYSMDVRHPNHPVIRDLLISGARGGAGVWGRGGPVISPRGRLFAATGDGKFDPSKTRFGSSVIAVSLPNLRVVDYYAPNNYQWLTQFDLDLGSTSPGWFADGGWDLLAAGGKAGTLYLLNADSLGAKDHHTPLQVLRLSNDQHAYEEYGIWGSISSWRSVGGTTYVYVPVWGQDSKQAPQFPLTNGPTPDGSVMAFKVGRNPATHKPDLEAVWKSPNLDRADPVAIANGVVFAISTGENPMQTTGPNVIYSGQKLLSDVQRSERTRHVILYALDARSGKVLYSSGDDVTGWTHFSGLAVANGQVYLVDHDSNLYGFGLKGKGN